MDSIPDRWRLQTLAYKNSRKINSTPVPIFFNQGGQQIPLYCHSTPLKLIAPRYQPQTICLTAEDE